VELELPAFEESSVEQQERSGTFVEEFRLQGRPQDYVLAEGRLINLACSEGHPSSVMDMSFANQAFVQSTWPKKHKTLQKKVYPVPGHIDREIARLKLLSMNVEIDTLTPSKRNNLSSWVNGDVGTDRPNGFRIAALEERPGKSSETSRLFGLECWRVMV